MFTLYFAPHTCALATHIALRDAGAQFELRRVSFKANEQQSAGYLAINPKGRVPTLITPDGALTETPAMLAYIAQMFPKQGLAPLDNPFAFAKLQEFNCYLCSTLHVAHAHRMRGHRWADEASSFADMQRKVPKSVSACYDLIERELLAGPWVFGDDYSIADPYLFTLAQWMEADGVEPSRFPKVAAHRARVAALGNVQAAIGAELAD
jgi:glutathione S-transferase